MPFAKDLTVSLAVILPLVGSLSAAAAPRSLADLVDPFIGVAGPGSCMPGPCLPHASIYPSPETGQCNPSGYSYTNEIVGFAQLHTQGTGGVPSYGNLLLSPQIGLATAEADHGSPKADEEATCYAYRVRLKRYDIACEVVPARHSALYRFTFPASDQAHILLDVARKVRGAQGLQDGTVSVDPATGAITGSGTYAGNWNPAPYKLYYCVRFSRKPTAVGTWRGAIPGAGATQASVAKADKLGAYVRFGAAANEPVCAKIAVSFKSAEQAAAWLDEEVPGWDFDGLKQQARATWERALTALDVSGAPPEEERRLYTALFHSLVQPRDRTGDNPNWESQAPYWDDHYTLWDTWKTLFPLLAIIRPDVVRDNVNSFIDRHQHNGYVATGFIQGKDYVLGQGGDEADNIIADAYVKGIAGIDWPSAYDVLRDHADKHRTPHYRTLGYVTTDGKHDYCRRMRSGSGTIAFSYADHSVAEVARGLGRVVDAAVYRKRAHNWTNVWDAGLADSGFTGFIRGRSSAGAFTKTQPRKGDDFYEGSCWIYSYVVSHDVPLMIEKMGGKQRFIDRLSFALHNKLIDFGNEPSFMTIWLFDAVNRPYLASYWANVLRAEYAGRALPGDDDSGAMSSLFIFLQAGFFPFAGQDLYYLHGPRFPKLTFNLPGGKAFTVVGVNAATANLYIQSATLNGQPLKNAVLHHKDIAGGGELVCVMGPAPSAWGCAGEFDSATAARELAPTR